MIRIAIVGPRKFLPSTEPTARALCHYLVTLYLGPTTTERESLCRGYPPKRLRESLTARGCKPPLTYQIPSDPITIVTGDCPTGIDAWVKEYGERAVVIHKAQWKIEGLQAGLNRNTRVVSDVDWVEAIWDSRSTGSLDTISKAYQVNKLRWVYQVAGDCVGAIPGHAWDPRVEALVREYKYMSTRNIHGYTNLGETIRKVLRKVTTRMEW